MSTFEERLEMIFDDYIGVAVEDHEEIRDHLDSLDIIEVVMEIEDYMGFQIPDTDYQIWETFGQIRAYVKSLR